MNASDQPSDVRSDAVAYPNLRNAAGEADRTVRAGGSSVPASAPSESDSAPDREALAALDQAQIRIMLASYSDILFVTMPFLLVLVLRLFRSPPLEVLARPEWALASAVLGGLAVVKLMLGLVSHEKMRRHRERLVFMVAATTFLLLMPSLLLAGVANVMDSPPGFLVYIHPVLLVIAIVVYSGAVQTSQALLKSQD